MNINLKIRYLTQDNQVLCFNHAISAAVLGVKIEPEVDDFGQDGDMRHTYCDWCVDGVPENIIELSNNYRIVEGRWRK